MEKVRAEVRCCCDVTKVVGTVEIDKIHYRHGVNITFETSEPTIDYLCSAWDAGVIPNAKMTHTALRTEVCHFYNDPFLVEDGVLPEVGLAIKSMNYPLSEWLKVRSFQVNPDFTGDKT